MPRKRKDTGLKRCRFCGNMFERRQSEALCLFYKRSYCSRSCASRNQVVPQDSELSPKTLYRTTKRNGRRTALHRLTIEEAIGRPLERSEIVHHRDGNKFNNDVSNLQIVTAKEHSQIHLQKHSVSYLCAICGKPFEPHPTKRGIKKNCSRECFRIYQRTSCGRYSKQQIAPATVKGGESYGMVIQ